MKNCNKIRVCHSKYIREIFPLNCRPRNYLYICTQFHVEICKWTFSRILFHCSGHAYFKENIFLCILALAISCITDFNKYVNLYVCIILVPYIVKSIIHATILYEYVIYIWFCLFANTGFWEFKSLSIFFSE